MEGGQRPENNASTVTGTILALVDPSAVLQRFAALIGLQTVSCAGRTEFLPSILNHHSNPRSRLLRTRDQHNTMPSVH